MPPCLDRAKHGYFGLTTRARRTLQTMDSEARAELQEATKDNPELAEAMGKMYEAGVGLLELVPEPRTQVAAKLARKMKAKHVEAIIEGLQKAKAYREEKRFLNGILEAELEGGRTALALQHFFDRTTRWMTPDERRWVRALSFLDVVNEQTIKVMMPDEPAAQILAWFKAEASIRSPTSTKWTVLPILRSRIQQAVRNDSPDLERYRQQAASLVPT
jgi:hypothetical protein